MGSGPEGGLERAEPCHKLHSSHEDKLYDKGSKKKVHNAADFETAVVGAVPVIIGNPEYEMLFCSVLAKA